MIVVRAAAVVCAAAVAAGCGAESSGRATVWVTRGRGSDVLHIERVPAGLTAMQALARVAKIRTRYGGRFVLSVDGIASRSRRDWFYYVNGYLADRSAAEYKLHPGDVEWWDFHRWSNPADDPVVVGAFPEPFRHGYAGRRRRAVVVARPDAPRAAVRRIAQLVGAKTILPRMSHIPAGTNVLLLMHTRGVFFQAEPTRSEPGSRVVFVYQGDIRKLARRPALARFRYQIPYELGP